jgi:hypothetical protein
MLKLGIEIIKIYREMEVQLHYFVAQALDGSEWSA